MSRYFRELGAEGEFDVESAIKAQSGQLTTLNETMAKDLFWRRVSAAATIAGTLFAAAKLVDIVHAIQVRRRSSST